MNGRKIKFSDKLSFWLRKLFFKFSKVQICANSEFTKGYLEKYFYKGKHGYLVDISKLSAGQYFVELKGEEELYDYIFIVQ